MRFAVLGDVHGNLEALDTVLKDIENQNVDCVFSTGDLVGYGPYPNEVIARIREEKILSIQGNFDEKIAGFSKILVKWWSKSSTAVRVKITSICMRAQKL